MNTFTGSNGATWRMNDDGTCTMFTKPTATVPAKVRAALFMVRRGTPVAVAVNHAQLSPSEIDTFNERIAS